MSESVKRALAIGASTGIGKATVHRLREPDWGVVAVTRRKKRLAALAAETGCEYVATDLSGETAVGALTARVLEGEPVDALVNNAGGVLGMDTIVYTDLNRWIMIYHCNVMTALRTTRASLSGMRERGGDLVLLTSTAAHDTYPGGGGYVAAKHAERIIANTLRQESVGESIRIIEIALRVVKTPEFSLNRLGSEEAAAKVYEGVAESLLTDDAADAICWALIRPAHVNIDSVILRPVAQATNILLVRQG